MTIEETLGERFREAMKARDEKVLGVIRMVRSEHKKLVTSEGFKEADKEETWRQVIHSYVKKLQKALPEYEEAGERGREMLEGLKFEIDYLRPFLPQVMDEAATEALVKETIAQVGAVSARMVGKVVGAIMKDHKGAVDPALVKKIAEKLLGGGPPAGGTPAGGTP
jgi:uncharacterized protein YqeY